MYKIRFLKKDKNLKKKIALIFFSYLLITLFSEVEALDQATDDLSASVEVAPVFSLYLNNPNLAFGLLSPGQRKVLGESRFFNEMRCRSNSGRSWYLKVQLVSFKLLDKPAAIAASNLSFKVAEFSGSAEPLGRYDFHEFSEKPLLIYTSQGIDNEGKEVIFRFQYRLLSPLDVPAGSYSGSITITMSESP
jgi:hypothetical protein